MYSANDKKKKRGEKIGRRQSRTSLRAYQVREISVLVYPLDYIHDIARREFARKGKSWEGAEPCIVCEARNREGGGNVVVRRG